METLDWLEWGHIATPLNFNIIQHGAFPKKVTTVDLFRNSNLELIAVAKGTGTFSLHEHINSRLGEEPFSYEEVTIGKTESGYLVKLKGVYITSVESGSKDLQVEDLDSLNIYAKVSEVEVFQVESPITTQIEWLVNFSTDNYILSRGTTRKRSIFFQRERSNGDLVNLNLNKQVSNIQDHFRCECKIDDQIWPLLVGHVMENIAPQKYKPGFVEFENLNEHCLVSEDVKETILMALSFALGRQLNSVGSTSLDKNNSRIQCTARIIYALSEKAYTKPSSPPAPIGILHQEWLLNEEKISEIISAVATKMKTINIKHALRLTWLALSAPLDVQAAHLGAAIETLKDSYCNSKIPTLLIPKDAWRKIRKPLLDTFDNTVASLNDNSLESSNLDVVKRKILEDLNKKSSNMQYEDFFNYLSLEVGEVEKQALKERNRPAHGHHYNSSDYQKLSMTVNALYALFNRLVLKITEADNVYIDYSTYGYPVRDINHPLGGPEGDGNPAFS